MLTKEERHEVYKFAKDLYLKNFGKFAYLYIRYPISEALHLIYKKCYCDEMFPEILNEFNMTKDWDIDSSDKDSRLKLFDEIIELTK